MSSYVADPARPGALDARPTAINRIAARALARFWRRAWRAVVVCQSRSRRRRALARLDDRLLDDIGIDRRAARAETAKPFWRD